MRMLAHDDALAMAPREHLINGVWVPSIAGSRFTIEDPATGDTLTDVADGTADDALAALDAAVAAASNWRSTPPRERADVLHRTYELLKERADDLALLMTLEMGKPLAESRAEVLYSAEFFRWFSEEAVRIDGRFTKSPAGGGHLLVLREPVGPCLIITPWNFPMAMGARKLAPALAAGCTTICKPARLTPLSMLALAGILLEAGLPPGVVNVVTTARAAAMTDALLGDDRVRKLSFTGSTAVGVELLAKAARNVLRTSMELGGNAPFLVFADAELDAAVDGAMTAKMRNMGEACTAANRFYVHASIAVEFGERLAARMAALRVGPGTEPDVDVGPMVDGAQRAAIAELVDDAVDLGAVALTGGHAVDRPGWFYAPTVLTDVPPGARVLREEIFGPVAPIVTFDTDEEAITEANRTEYGLAAYVYTGNLERALRIVEAVEAGMIGLNQGLVSNPAAPFGGIKRSGLGREGGAEGIDEYLETKYVAVHAS